VDIPDIGFGTWKILLNGKAERVVAEALESGYRLIDTAMIYGNEKGVGSAVAKSKIPRSEIFLTTKLWNFDQGYQKALQAFDKSLSGLGLDYLDLYLIHWPRSSKLTQDSWRALEEIHKSGRAKYIGVSNFLVRDIEDLLKYSTIKPYVNQIEFHPFVFEVQKPILDFCQNHGILVEAYSPLARAVQMNHPVISQISKEIGKSPSQVMIRWAIQHNTIPIPKTTHKERMKENIDVFDFELSSKRMSQMDSLSTGQSVI
jgi:diketogulonate reductase-like aldo/keto reductase